MTDTAQPNKELLLKTLQYIKDHPEEWDQSKWICGTTACFAGHAVLLAGAVAIGHMGDNNETAMVRFGQDMRRVSDLAVELLCLTTEQSGQLFGATNTLEDLEYVVSEIVGSESPHGPAAHYILAIDAILGPKS